MKYLLIEESGRVAQVCEAVFPVAEPLAWVAVDDAAIVKQDDRLDLASGELKAAEFKIRPPAMEVVELGPLPRLAFTRVHA
jgi:hypothetical protein